MIVTALLLGVAGIAACGTDRRGSSTAAVANRASVHSPRAHPTLLSDYDDDDYLYGYDDEDTDNHHFPKDRDGDDDNEGPVRGYYDHDNFDIDRFGPPAMASERAPVAALARRYYTAAAHAEGARICGMLAPSREQAFIQSVSERGFHFLHGLSTCPQIASKFFAGGTKILAFSLRLHIVTIRVSHNIALVVVEAKSFPIRLFEAIRERGKWYAYSALDVEIP